MDYTEKQNRTVRWLTLAVLVLFVPIATGNQAFVFASVAENPSGTEKLVYSINDLKGHGALLLFDPQTNTRRLLPSIEDRNLNSKGLLAYTLSANAQSSIYVLDTKISGSVPIRLTQITEKTADVIGWSPDERLLAFKVQNRSNDNSFRVYIWNDKDTLDITPQNLVLSQDDIEG